MANPRTLADEVDTNDRDAAGLSPLDAEQLEATIAVLQRIVADRGVLAEIPRQQRSRLYELAGRVAHPGRTARRQLNRAKKRQRRAELALLKAADRQVLATTTLRKKNGAAWPVGIPAVSAEATSASSAAEPAGGSTSPARLQLARLQLARNCYICKQDYQDVHPFYDSLCPSCAELNWEKRHQTADLSGRVALVTGGRVKIGYEAALKLLRSGAQVVVTTRFPRDAASRFVKESDQQQWCDRLQIHGLDMRHTPSVESLADYLRATLPRLDFLLNNACQTVRKPPGFYAHLMATEREPLAEPPHRSLAAHHDHLHQGDDRPVPLSTGEMLVADSVQRLVGSRYAAELSQLELIDGDDQWSAFPEGEFDADDQQVDHRAVNSWRLRLAEVSTIELLEVHLVNAVAPFVLAARLKPLMLKQPSHDKHIVNVSAMEGVFYRSFKTDKHPHTNMAKAALNMLTRTSAQDYVRDGIHMNSVDTGWITDEDPMHITQRKQQEFDFHPPLDCVDAAARICDPIFSGFLSGQHVWGHFWKDYQISRW